MALTNKSITSLNILLLLTILVLIKFNFEISRLFYIISIVISPILVFIREKRIISKILLFIELLIVLLLLAYIFIPR